MCKDEETSRARIRKIDAGNKIFERGYSSGARIILLPNAAFLSGPIKPSRAAAKSVALGCSE